MEQIRGANLGNWLVLEEWMDVDMFKGTGAKDEVWLNRLMDKEELARRYVDHPALYGIEVLNEPISLTVWLSSPSGPIRGKPVDKEEAKGSSYVPMKFLKPFYREAYRRLRAILPEEKTIVFHDGFRLTGWNRFFDESGMKNVCLDTHIYIFAMESFVPIHTLWCYRIYVGFNKWKLSQVAKHVPVMVGEWCISNRYAGDRAKKGDPDAETEARKRYREVAALQMDAWSVSAGYVYWNYQLWRDRSGKMDEDWKESWDLARCWKYGWMPQRLDDPS